MATATIHICDVCGAEDKKQTEFKLKVYTSNGEVVREMDLCIVCNENLGKLIMSGKSQSLVKPPRKEKKQPAIDLVKDVFTPVAARQTLLKAGLPPETPSISLDKACVSAMSAAKLATMALQLGEIDTAIAGGATSFSQIPLIVRGMRASGFRIGDQKMEDPCFKLGYKDYNPVAVDADDVAHEWGVTREEMDEWAVRSHQLYGQAFDAGQLFRGQIEHST